MNKSCKKILALIVVCAMAVFFSNMANAQPSYEAQVQALYDKEDALNAELERPNPDKARIKSLSREIGELKGQLLSSEAQGRGSRNYYRDNSYREGYQGRYQDNYGGDYRGYWHHGHHGGRGCCW